MNKKINIVPLKNLNLSNRFLFDEVMEDVQTHQNALEIIFGKEISLLDKPQTEKEFRISPLIRSVRMDVFAMDKEQSVYNTEMQDQKKKDLAKRSRYYQSMIDTSLLEPGIPNYNLLSQSFIIIITTFDLFGFGKYVYTFEPRCREVPECALADDATRIFLNTKGKNDDEISEELAEFLHYIENSTDAAANHIKSAKIFLISASLFFYGYWKWLYLPLLLSSMIINYFIATAILKHNSTLLINAKNMRGGGPK